MPDTSSHKLVIVGGHSLYYPTCNTDVVRVGRNKATLLDDEHMAQVRTMIRADVPLVRSKRRG